MKGAQGYLLDTHVWLWYLAGSDRLPRSLRALVDESAADCWLSPISIWEVGLLAERGRVEIQGELRSWAEEALVSLPLREAPLNREVALRSREIRLPHRDPADHFLAATALVYELTLVTVDDRLTAAEWLPTLGQ